MSYEIEKNGADKDIVVSGWEQGIAVSPHKGIANIQNGNIATETGEVLASYGRLQNSMTNSNGVGTLNFEDTAHVFLNISGTNNKFSGMWITVSSSSDTGELPNGNYYVLNNNLGKFGLATTFNGTQLTGFTAGLTANFNLIRNFGQAIQSATEPYIVGGQQFFRYYVLDNQGLVWFYDSANDLFPNDNTEYWMLPDISESYWGSDAQPSGILVLNGNLFVFSGHQMWTKPTVCLGNAYVAATNAILMSPANSLNPHFGFTGHQGRGYYTDGSFIGSIFPNTSLLTGANNVQSYSSWFPPDSTHGEIQDVINGSIPSVGPNVGVSGFSRIPAVFFPATGGTAPSALSANTIYYIEYSTANGTFQVFAALTGGSALNVSTGATGQQYFNTFWMIGTHAGAYGDTSTVIFSPQRLALPSFEISQCMTEVGNTIIFGCRGTAMYPWNQVDPVPSGIINLPEANVQSMLTVNQMAYIFAGFKGYVYITDGSVASLVIKVPDYCAGIPGSPNTYIEPNFTWGGTAYIRGRVYFSVLDQTSNKAGNCGGIWSFIPTQNLYIGQDTGIALRQENISSYATYNGYSTVLIPFGNQNEGPAPQFFSCWNSNINNATYGIDRTGVQPGSSPVIVETDLIPVGTVLQKYTPKQLEYKLSAPLLAGETIAVAWRKNGNGTYTSAGNVITPDGATSLSGYFSANFQGAQWVQLQLTMTPLSGTNSSWTRLAQFRIR